MDEDTPLESSLNSLRYAGFQKTDVLGQFTFRGLPAGSFIVCANQSHCYGLAADNVSCKHKFRHQPTPRDFGPSRNHL
jgi:hypothetical protein